MSTEKNNYTILYFLDYGKRFGGAANTLIQQAILMKKAGYSTVLFFSDYLGTQLHEEYKEICVSLGIEYEWATYQISSHTEDIDLVCLNENYEKLRDKIISYQPAFLHSVQINPCVELISRECKIPHIMNIYPALPQFFSIDYMNIFPHYHICDSRIYARMWQQYLHTDSTCIRTVVNIETFPKKETLKPFLRCICAGSLYKRKNQLTVIKAFHRVLRAGIHGKLTLCGYAEGDYGSECVRYIEENSLQYDIVIKGFCSDMNQEYLQHDILICGSMRESYPNVISEAMANGLVVVSTPVAGVPEIIMDGENGYLAQDYSVDALYKKIIQVHADIKSGRIESVIAKAEETFWKKHSPKAVTKQLIQYYQHVIDDYKQGNDIASDRELINIATIRASFSFLLEKFYRHQESFREPDKVALKLWYLYHIQGALREAVARKSSFYIWGTGRYGVVVKQIVETFIPEVQIAGFLDSYRTGEFQGYKTYQPDEIMQRENTVIFLAIANGQEEIVELLEERKLVFNRDFFILSVRRW